MKREGKQLFRLCLVNGLLNESRVSRVGQLAAAAGRRQGPAVLAHFLRLVRLDRARHTASIESATDMPAELQTTIEASLKSRYGAGLIFTFGQRPALIGGVRIQVGSDVYDGSIQARLNALNEGF